MVAMGTQDKPPPLYAPRIYTSLNGKFPRVNPNLFVFFSGSNFTTKKTAYEYCRQKRPGMA
jgi:hypothetical protein